MYTDVRRYVDKKFKQVNDGGTIYQTSEIIEAIANQYGHYVNAVEHVLWGLYTDTVSWKIDCGYPSLWRTSNDTYGKHIMAVCGYKYYSKTFGWWIFKTTDYKLFFELKDGHADDDDDDGSTDPRYYDISGHSGFAAIISLEF